MILPYFKKTAILKKKIKIEAVSELHWSCFWAESELFLQMTASPFYWLQLNYTLIFKEVIVGNLTLLQGVFPVPKRVVFQFASSKQTHIRISNNLYGLLGVSWQLLNNFFLFCSKQLTFNFVACNKKHPLPGECNLIPSKFTTWNTAIIR